MGTVTSCENAHVTQNPLKQRIRTDWGVILASKDDLEKKMTAIRTSEVQIQLGNEIEV